MSNTVSAADTAELDHLVVLARTLEDGVRWAEQTLGVTPSPGGQHPLMGTHNRLLAIAGSGSGSNFDRAYLEIIAIDPAATPQRAHGLKRWFDMDDAQLQARVASEGPQLIHAVFRVPDIEAAVAALAAQGLYAGRVIAASRPTVHGLLQWRISVRDDGRRLMDGCVPTLIQWGGEGAGLAPHPTDHLPSSGLRLSALRVQHPDVEVLRAALGVLGWAGEVQACDAADAGWVAGWEKAAV